MTRLLPRELPARGSSLCSRVQKGPQEPFSGHGVPKEILGLAHRILVDERGDSRARELAVWVLKWGGGLVDARYHD